VAFFLIAQISCMVQRRLMDGWSAECGHTNFNDSGKCFKRLEKAGPNQRLSNWFVYSPRKKAIKSADRILGIVTNFDILFSGSKFHPIVYCINQKTVDVLFGMEMEASNGRIRMQARHVLDMSSRVWLLPSEDLEWGTGASLTPSPGKGILQRLRICGRYFGAMLRSFGCLLKSWNYRLRCSGEKKGWFEFKGCEKDIFLTQKGIYINGII